MDKRTDFQKTLWDKVGPPLYYSSECMLSVDVSTKDGQAVITRPCGDCNCGVIAPRKSMLAGEGGLKLADQAKMSWWKLKALLTGRCA